MAVKRLGPLRRFVVILVKSVMTPMTRRTWTGQEHIPPTGGVILAPNHLSHADPLVMAHFVYDAHRWPRFLGKASVFRVPVIGRLILRVQQIPVERGSVDAVKSLEALTAALKDGGAVIIYPEGTTTREPDLWPMRGKTGAARLALATGAPVIPIAQWGAQGFYDTRTKKVRVRPRTPITIAAGPPVDLSRWAGAEPTRATLDEMTDEIMLRVRDLLAGIRGETPPPLWAPAKGEKA
ncbi:lysophospholipid acyltransferase family protein [Phytohabitans houttuyneae]|uniref:lysophospholipid acyltransferase family protein n=1 Tax=Phytohabitans houttuyneae TaxID=1076126 RepID=UPI0031E50024